MKNQRTQKGLLGRWYQLNNLRYLKLIKRIKKNEGFSSIPYKDQLGFLTIGYGHLILSEEKYLIETKPTKTKLEKLFIQDFKNAVKDYKKYLKLSKAKMITNLYAAYDSYLRKKYKVEINYNALDNLKKNIK